jgi:GT2 family glycosyltransferase
MLPRTTIERVGLLDENFFYSPEDVDYCLRVWMAGLSILYNPHVTAIHHTQELSRKFTINSAFLSHVNGLFYYFRKHRYLFKKPVFDQSVGITLPNYKNKNIFPKNNR